MKGLTMRRRRKSQRRVIASILTGVFIVQQTMTLSVLASEISGVTGVNGVYNIDPTKTTNGIGFRHYEKFNLSQGDIANLNYTDISTFVNMVDNQININGIVNTVKGGNFHAGKAIFISPNGMVVGASGVLNVGSLGAYTPTEGTYNTLVRNQTEGALNNAMNNGGGKAITINGKVFTSGDAILKGGKVNIGNQGGIVAGINETQRSIINDNSTANTLFNNLVNTDNLTTGSSFASKNGVIQITSNEKAETAGINVAGHLVNYNTETVTETKTYTNGNGDPVTVTTDIPNIHLQNGGNDGITVSGTIANNQGVVKIQSTTGDLNISGNVINRGTTQIFNTPAVVKETGTVNGQSYTYTSDVNTGLNISGNINTTGELTINNAGTEGTNISGTINHAGELSILNGIDANTDLATERNASMDALNITGTINNITGNTAITNHAAGGLNVSEAGAINTNGLTMLNTGADGFTINGSVTNNGTAQLTNKDGAMNIGGTFTNTGNATVLNDGTVLNISGDITNNTGNLDITNNGAGGLNVTATGNIDADGLDVLNTGAGGLNISGTVENVGTADITNKAGSLNIAGEVNNTGNATILNDGTGLNISGEVNNNNGTLAITNNGIEGLNIDGTVCKSDPHERL